MCQSLLLPTFDKQQPRPAVQASCEDQSGDFADRGPGCVCILAERAAAPCQDGKSPRKAGLPMLVELTTAANSSGLRGRELCRSQ